MGPILPPIRDDLAPVTVQRLSRSPFEQHQDQHRNANTYKYLKRMSPVPLPLPMPRMVPVPIPAVKTESISPTSAGAGDNGSPVANEAPEPPSFARLPSTGRDLPSIRQWSTSLLSPSPSPTPPRQASARDDGSVSPVPLDRAASVPTPLVEIKSREGSIPLPLVYRSPPPLPRLDTAAAAAAAAAEAAAASKVSSDQQQSPPRPRRLYPRDFYPTPVTQLERERVRWPGPISAQPRALEAEARTAPPPRFDCAPRDAPYLPALSTHRPSHSFSSYPYREPGRHALPSPHARHSSYGAAKLERLSPPLARADFLRPPAYVHPGSGSEYRLMRPRLSIHPYAPPAPAEHRFYSAGPLGRGREERRTMSTASSAFSPSSAISPGGQGKGPRKRADDVQLTVLNEVFERTAYPSTEEREELARRLGMTSRSVQIWFQNRRRSVKVEQQSAMQRAEADAAAMQARARGLAGPPYLNAGLQRVVESDRERERGGQARI